MSTRTPHWRDVFERSADATVRLVAPAVEWVAGTLGTEDLLARLWWSILVEPGDRVAGALIRAHGPAVALDLVWSAPSTLPAELFAARSRWDARMRPDLVRRAANVAATHRMRFLGPAEPEYSPGLRDLGDHAPVALWAFGTASVSWKHSVSLVGARAATAYGDHVASDLAYGIAPRATVISGGAYGIDRAAHRGALAAKGSTVAFLAGGLDRLYPAGNTALFEQIGRSGLLLSETPPGTTPTKWRFLARNRLIASATQATVVVEAGSRSGALNTAHHALELGRPVGAVPGPITSSASVGTNHLLRESFAVAICGVEDLAELCELSDDRLTSTAEGAPLITSLHSRVADALTRTSPRDVARVVQLSGVPEPQVREALAELEVLGLCQSAPGGWTITEAWLVQNRSRELPTV